MTEEIRVLRHESTIRRAVWPPLIAMAVLAALLIALVAYLLYAVRWATHSSNVIYKGYRVMLIARTMESGKRGFFLAGDVALLAPYDRGAKRVDEAFNDLTFEVRDNAQQTARVREMRTAFDRWRTRSESEVRDYRDKSPQTLARTFNDRESERLMDAVRIPLTAFIDEEKNLLVRRNLAAQNAIRWSILLGGLATVGVGGALAFTTRRQLRELGTQYETVLDGEARVRERLATTLTSIGDGVVVTDAMGNIMLLNPVAETLTGWMNDEVQGKEHKDVFDIYNETSGERVSSPIDEAIRDNRTVLLANHTALKRRDGSRIAIEDSAAPVRDRSGVVSGAVLVFRDVTERKEQEEELAAALAKNVRIAETLQRSMLTAPAKTAFEGVTLATVYEPAWEEAQVGGDFFDVFSFWDGQVALVVGDATGKGLDAAATTSEVKYALRAYLHDEPDPAMALTRLNCFLAHVRAESGDPADFTPPSFVALTVAVLNLRTGAVATAVAGADPPLILRSSGEAIAIGRPGIMLGALENSTYESSHEILASGDLLGMVTDGVTEARRGRREFFGYEGFTNAMQAAAVGKEAGGSPSLDDMATFVLAEAKNYTGGRLSDDVCLLLARRE